MLYHVLLILTVKKISAPVVKQIDDGIFTKRYLGNCMDCSFCDDICCSYGCAVDRQEVATILKYAGQLEPELGIPSSRWFEDKFESDVDYPSGEVCRTKVLNGRCVFFKRGFRGCSIHRFGLNKGVDIHQIKPMVCSLFPVTWEDDRMFVSSFLDELPCKDKGVTVFEAQKDVLKVYFGSDFVSELERRCHK